MNMASRWLSGKERCPTVQPSIQGVAIRIYRVRSIFINFSAGRVRESSFQSWMFKYPKYGLDRFSRDELSQIILTARTLVVDQNVKKTQVIIKVGLKKRQVREGAFFRAWIPPPKTTLLNRRMTVEPSREGAAGRGVGQTEVSAPWRRREPSLQRTGPLSRGLVGPVGQQAG